MLSLLETMFKKVVEQKKVTKTSELKRESSRRVTRPCDSRLLNVHILIFLLYINYDRIENEKLRIMEVTRKHIKKVMHTHIYIW